MVASVPSAWLALPIVPSTVTSDTVSPFTVLPASPAMPAPTWMSTAPLPASMSSSVKPTDMPPVSLIVPPLLLALYWPERLVFR